MSAHAPEGVTPVESPTVDPSLEQEFADVLLLVAQASQPTTEDVAVAFHGEGSADTATDVAAEITSTITDTEISATEKPVLTAGSEPTSFVQQQVRTAGVGRIDSTSQRSAETSTILPTTDTSVDTITPDTPVTANTAATVVPPNKTQTELSLSERFDLPVARVPDSPTKHQVQAVSVGQSESIRSQPIVTRAETDTIANQDYSADVDAANEQLKESSAVTTPQSDLPLPNQKSHILPTVDQADGFPADTSSAPVFEATTPSATQIVESVASAVSPTPTEPLAVAPGKASDVGPVAVSKQVAEHIVAARLTQPKPGRTELQIKLDPPHLGTLSVEIIELNDQLSARVTAVDGVTLQKLQSQLPNLFESLDQAGIEFTEFDLGQRQDFGSEQDRENSPQFPAHETELFASSGPELTRETRGRIDITV